MSLTISQCSWRVTRDGSDCLETGDDAVETVIAGRIWTVGAGISCQHKQCQNYNWNERRCHHETITSSLSSHCLSSITFCSLSILSATALVRRCSGSAGCKSFPQNCEEHFVCFYVIIIKKHLPAFIWQFISNCQRLDQIHFHLKKRKNNKTGEQQRRNNLTLRKVKNYVLLSQAWPGS